MITELFVESVSESDPKSIASIKDNVNVTHHVNILKCNNCVVYSLMHISVWAKREAAVNESKRKLLHVANPRRIRKSVKVEVVYRMIYLCLRGVTKAFNPLNRYVKVEGLRLMVQNFCFLNATIFSPPPPQASTYWCWCLEAQLGPLAFPVAPQGYRSRALHSRPFSTHSAGNSPLTDPGKGSPADRPKANRLGRIRS